MQIITHKAVSKFLESLEVKLKTNVYRQIELLKIYGYFLSMPHSKKIARGLYELRVTGDIHVRIFYTFRKDNIILLHGFIKKSHKIPKKELNLAKQRLESLTQV